MQVEPSGVAGIELIGPRDVAFKEAIEILFGRAPDGLLKPALPYSVIARNNSSRTLALLGIRFDMVGRNAKRYSVIHYADTLRFAEKGSLTPGAMRFVCAEPLYTDLVLRQARQIDRRGPMNLANLRTVLRIGAALDCAAFDDGQFAGPDTLGSFDRMEAERAAEIDLLESVLTPGAGVEAILAQALEVPSGGPRERALVARRVLARRLSEGFAQGGLDGVVARAGEHRLRIRLWRQTGTSSSSRSSQSE